MKPENQLPDVVPPTPDKLLALFARGRIGLWLAVALAAHLVLIGGTSVGYIRDRWIDPDGAVARKAAADAVAAAAAAAKKASAKPVAAPAAGTATNAPSATGPGPSEQTTLDERKDTPVVKRISAAAASNELPRVTDDLGISINDTTVK
jgi:hypothetical protein